MRQGDHSGSPLPVRERHGDDPHCLPLMPVDRRTPSLTSEQEQTRLTQQDPKQRRRGGGGGLCFNSPLPGSGHKLPTTI